MYENNFAWMCAQTLVGNMTAGAAITRGVPQMNFFCVSLVATIKRTMRFQVPLLVRINENAGSDTRLPADSGHSGKTIPGAVAS